jgi:hypothetical protein
MAMTAEEMIRFFADQAGAAHECLDAAARSGNYYVAALNVREGFKCHLMKGLLQWRHGLGDPVAAMSHAAGMVQQGLTILMSIRPTEPPEAHLLVTPSLFVSYLANRPMPAFDEDHLVSATYQGTPRMIAVLKAELQVDGFVGRALWDRWDEAKWYAASQAFQQNKRASLACETYRVYARLLKTPADQAEPLVREAEALFRKRAKDRFYAGGRQTEGGGPDNDFTVDYRLAAILKKVGYTGETIHLWRWG